MAISQNLSPGVPEKVRPAAKFQPSKIPVIEAVDLHKVYESIGARTHALKGVSLKVYDGDFVAIIGPSGSGKSTLMNILGCLDVPSSGVCKIAGVDVSTLDSKELAKLRREQIGFVFQSFNLLPRASVLRNVMLPMLYTKVAASKRKPTAEKALAETSMPESLWTHKSNELSGGQMQRVAIARALVNEPGLILADEPTGNLDTETSEHILALFQKLNDEGRTIVLITHEPEIAEHAKRIIRIQDGLAHEVK